MNPSIQFKKTTSLAVLMSFMLAYFWLSPQARAVCQEGCLTGNNTVFGDDALLNNTGIDNTAIGFDALKSNTTGGGSTAIGFEALQNSITGLGGNTAVGFETLQQDTFGYANTALGTLAMFFNTSGSVNTAVGYAALQDNTTGNYNAALGLNALEQNTTGFTNTALGSVSLEGNTTGSSNTAVGYSTLVNNTTGSSNIAIGDSAGSTLTTGSNNIDIGNKANAGGESNTIRVGTTGTHTKTIIAGIFGSTVAGGVGVIVGSGGRLGTVVSSARFKEAIKPMDKASEAILALKPVTFRYKHKLDPEGIPQFGLVAEDVEKVNPDLVARDEQGKPYTVRYEAVNAMLLNEFLKEHRKGQEQDATIRQLKTELAQQQKEIKALSTQIQKVSTQVELSKPAPQTVLNNQ